MKNEALVLPFIPAAWKTQPLAKIAAVFTDGNWIESKDQADSGVRLVQTGNVGIGQFKDRSEKARFIDEPTFARLKCFEVLPGDILISRLPDPVGRACIIPDTGQKMITAVDCSIVRVRDAAIDPKFLVYYSQTQEYLRAVDVLCSGTTRRRISRKNLGNVPVLLPPLDEQKRIVAALDQAFAALDRARAHAEANLTGAETLFKEILRNQMESDSKVFGTIELNSLSEHVTDGDHQPPPKAKEGVPFITISNIEKISHQIDFASTFFVSNEYFQNLSEKRRPQQGDILYTVTGSFGIPILVRNYPDFCFQRHIALIRPNSSTDSRWLRFMLMSPQCFEQAEVGATGTAQRTVSLKVLRTLTVPKTPISEQTKSADKLETQWEKCSGVAQRYESTITDLANLRQSLLQKAFSGQLT